MNRWKVQPEHFLHSNDASDEVRALCAVGRVLCDIRHILEVLIPQNDSLAPYDEEAESFVHVAPSASADEPPSSLGGLALGVDKHE